MTDEVAVPHFICGDRQGRDVVYFHGAPGSIEECVIFDAAAKVSGLKIVCLDRFSVKSSANDKEDCCYYKRLAQEITRITNGKTIDIVGFSIGAFVSIQTCRYLREDQVRSLHLVSAAAPLEMGDFIGKMAGKWVFKLAKVSPLLLTLLTCWQRLLLWLFPSVLFDMLFATAAGEDRELAKSQAFRRSMIDSLQSCFMFRSHGYIRDVSAYVRPWNHGLHEIVARKTYIWHGDKDNWSPKSMAELLKSSIAGQPSLNIFDGLSHYSCLHKSTSSICNILQKLNHQEAAK